MSEANKILVRRLIDEIWNQCSTTAMDELIDNDIIRRDPAPFGELNGREAYKQLVLADFAAFPDLRVTLVDMIAEGDCVAGAWTAQGTHTGTMTLPGVQFAPTGKTASFDGTSRLRLRAGRFVEDLVAWSPLSMFQQLGLAADPVAAGANRLMMVRVMEELFNQGKLAVADECCTRDYVHHGPQGVDSRGPQ
ncbi:MAG: ester cyclase, partial [Acidobacteria bacterium]|nr:ester cyclase [Acidobacteriota bacterium]